MARLLDTAHRIDREPVLFLGCSGTEITTLAALGFLSGIPIGIIVGIVSTKMFLIIPFPFAAAFLAVYYGGKRLGEMKEGKPDGYYARVIMSFLSARGFLWYSNLYIKRDGHWGIRR